LAVQAWTYGVLVSINRVDYHPNYTATTRGTIKLEKVAPMVREYLAEKERLTD